MKLISSLFALSVGLFVASPGFAEMTKNHASDSLKFSQKTDKQTGDQIIKYDFKTRVKSTMVCSAEETASFWEGGVTCTAQFYLEQ